MKAMLIKKLALMYKEVKFDVIKGLLLKALDDVEDNGVCRAPATIFVGLLWPVHGSNT